MWIASFLFVVFNVGFYGLKKVHKKIFLFSYYLCACNRLQPKVCIKQIFSKQKKKQHYGRNLSTPRGK